MIIYLKFTVYNKKLSNTSKVSLVEINTFKGKYMYYSTFIGSFELVSILTISILILLHAFHEALTPELEMNFMTVGVAIFSLSFWRAVVIVSTKLRYTEKYIYINRGFSEKKYDLSKIYDIKHSSTHLIFRTEESNWLCYIPVGINNIDIVYKLVKNMVDIKKGIYDEFDE
jgi:hypothetical protein